MTLWWVEKTGVGLCAIEKDGFCNKTEQPQLMYEMERRFGPVGVVVYARRKVSACLERTGGRRPKVLISSARPGCAQFSEAYDCRCPVRPKQMWVIGLRETIDPSRVSSGNCTGFFPTYGSPSTSLFAECAV